MIVDGAALRTAVLCRVAADCPTRALVSIVSVTVPQAHCAVPSPLVPTDDM